MKKGGIITRIHQGRHDTEKELLNLVANAERLNRLEVLDAVHLRMRLCHR